MNTPRIVSLVRTHPCSHTCTAVDRPSAAQLKRVDQFGPRFLSPDAELLSERSLAPSTALMIDVENVSSIDTTALQDLMELLRLLRDGGRDVYFVGGRSGIVDLLRRCHLERFLLAGADGIDPRPLRIAFAPIVAARAARETQEQDETATS